MKRKRVLFLCTGNSARSQMAEGLVNHFLGDAWEALSAGTRPAGYVHPLAIQAMAEIGINIADQWSKSVERFHDEDFDLIITVCDHAARNCPVWLGRGHWIHLGFPDPAAADGGSSGKLQIFRQVRNAIQGQVLEYIVRLDEQNELTGGLETKSRNTDFVLLPDITSPRH